MSTNCENTEVWKVFILRAEDEISQHITGTLNDCCCHVNVVVVAYKALPTRMLNVTLMADAVELHVKVENLFWISDVGMLLKITHWSDMMAPLFGSVSKCKGSTKRGLLSDSMAPSLRKKGHWFYVRDHKPKKKMGISGFIFNNVLYFILKSYLMSLKPSLTPGSKWPSASDIDAHRHPLVTV